MPAFDFNPADAVAGFIKFPKGVYQIELGEPKAYYFKGKEGKEDNYGVGFMSKIVESEDPQWKGKKISINCGQSNDMFKGFAKQIQMAAFGYDVKKLGDEEKFNEFSKSFDWKFNTDDKSAGEGWHKMSKNIIVQDLDITIDPNGDPQQQSRNTRPLIAAE